MTPKFSIIIPVYNVAPYLRECLDSVLAQTFTDWEAICVDDGATDGSGVILDDYVKLDKRFKAVHQKNGGVSVARNVALQIARGFWVFFLDGDDVIHPNLLEHILRIAEDEVGLDAIGIKMRRFCGEFHQEPCPLVDTPRTICLGESVLISVDRKMSAFADLALDKFYKLSVIRSLQLEFVPGMRISEDVLFARLFLAQCGNICLCHELEGYFYRERDASAVHNRYNVLIDDPFVMYRKFKSLWRRTRRVGLKRCLIGAAMGVFRWGAGRIYSHSARVEAIDKLLVSREFLYDVIPFLILHGSVRWKLKAFLYFVAPRTIKQLVLDRR